MPPLRKRGSSDDVGEEHKRFKATIEENASELVCPITQELPLDPVIAEDGHVYDRAAIERWIAKGNGKSPKTNEIMGTALLPALQVKNMIISMVKSGALSGAMAESWQKQLHDQQCIQKCRAAAATGDTDAMVTLANSYLTGRCGVEKDTAKGLEWA
mmetsp:Transcript_13341/g.26836  ORF Transcript_13341/g.26836 Transcript_13341/m.26836 type:complete len:157 (+) Transcript_13341:76-546(+)